MRKGLLLRFDAGVSRRFKLRFAWPLVIAFIVASGLPLLEAPAAAATPRCSGYRACNRSPYTNHGYNRTTNHKSYWNQYVGDNCTNYVAYLLVTHDGWPNRLPWSGSGNASHWGVAEADVTDTTPAAGSVAWWPAHFHGAGSLGHVAYVEHVFAHAIVVSEDSFPSDGKVDYSGDAYDWRVIPAHSRGWPRGFIHFSEARSSRAELDAGPCGPPSTSRPSSRRVAGRTQSWTITVRSWCTGDEPTRPASHRGTERRGKVDLVHPGHRTRHPPAVRQRRPDRRAALARRGDGACLRRGRGGFVGTAGPHRGPGFAAGRRRFGVRARRLRRGLSLAPSARGDVRVDPRGTA